MTMHLIILWERNSTWRSKGEKRNFPRMPYLLSCRRVRTNCLFELVSEKITLGFSFIYIHTTSIISEERKHPDQECSICLDDMYNTDVIALECNHRFHKKCINDWFREKHDCPQCRNYSLPKDDFPSLLSGGRWICFHTICLISRNYNISIRLYHIYDINEYFMFSRNVW